MSDIMNKLLKSTELTSKKDEAPTSTQSPNNMATPYSANKAPVAQVDAETKKITQGMQELGVKASNGNVVRSRKLKLSLGDLTILRTLGTGSFGRVHLVQLKKTSEFFAMKVMKKSEVVRLKQVEHTMNEKKILDMIEHPFLVNMIGSFQDSVNLYIVMEYVAGGEMFSLLRRSQVFFLSSRKLLILLVEIFKLCFQVLCRRSCACI